MLSSGLQKLATRVIVRGNLSLSRQSSGLFRCHPPAFTKRNFSRTHLQPAKTVSITYVDPDGEETTVNAEIGQNLLNVAHDNNVELEGACGGELACSTCHLIFEEEIYNTLPEMEEDEEDMLDLALEITDTSRLGCQILVREDFEGTKVKIPDDGF